MATYFSFSDECGDYTQYITPKQLKVHPFYIRATLTFKSDEWKKLRDNFIDLKNQYSIPLHEEVKWAYLWNLNFHEQRQQPIPKDKPYKFLESVGFQGTLNFVNDSLKLIHGLTQKFIILTFSDNKINSAHKEYSIIKFHIQEIMQRIEMQLQSNNENLCVLFFDPVNERKNDLFREIYHDFYLTGDFVQKYNHIKDTLNIEPSHQSVGIQIADFISGAFSSVLKANSSNNYKDGLDMFFDHVYPHLRRVYGWVYGYGIREVPKSSLVRRNLRTKIDNMIVSRQNLQSNP